MSTHGEIILQIINIICEDKVIIPNEIITKFHAVPGACKETKNTIMNYNFMIKKRQESDDSDDEEGGPISNIFETMAERVSRFIALAKQLGYIIQRLVQPGVQHVVYNIIAQPGSHVEINNHYNQAPPQDQQK